MKHVHSELGIDQFERVWRKGPDGKCYYLLPSLSQKDRLNVEDWLNRKAAERQQALPMPARPK